MYEMYVGGLHGYDGLLWSSLSYAGMALGYDTPLHLSQP